MALRVVSTFPAPFDAILEHAVRQALVGRSEDLDVSIMPGMDPDHAEIVILQDGERRGAYSAPLAGRLPEHVDKIQALMCPRAATAGGRSPETTSFEG
jgi:hypothetical protein